MRKFKVYQRRWGTSTKRMITDYETGQIRYTEVYYVDMVPIMSINAYSPEAALRIAKQKGVIAPIIGAANELA